MTIQRIRQLTWQNMVYNTEEAKPYFTILGSVLILAFIGFYFFNLKIAIPGGYENFPLRLITAFFGMLLILYKYWPESFVVKAPLIFYGILIFSFPFFFSYMLFKNPTYNIWQINELIGLVLLTFFVDWISFLLMTIIGISIAIVATYISSDAFELNNNLIAVFGSYSAPVIYFIIFSSKRKQLSEERNNYHNQIFELKNQLEQKVEERTTELERSLAAKTEFLNNISHEIRTPMQGFTVISSSLVEHWKSFDDERKYELAGKIASNAMRLSSLLNHLLDLSKFQTGKMIMSLEKIDLNLIITEMIDEAKTLYINGKQLAINYTPLKEAFILADKERIGQVLRNLFVNSIKFSLNNSTITVSLSSSDINYDDQNKSEAYHFSIKDEGVGIPEDELYTIFKAFVQSTKTKTKAGGIGLGLAICKEIVESHHGEIWAENNESSGATFNLILPVSQAKQIDGHHIIAENNVAITKPAPQTTKSANILIIDDEETCLTSMELLLFGSNYNLHKAVGGYAGLEYLKEHHHEIDIVLLDLMMPDIYGLNLLTEIKKDPELAKTPVILQTGSSDNAEIERAFTLGIITYIKKPYQRQNIMFEIDGALDKGA